MNNIQMKAYLIIKTVGKGTQYLPDFLVQTARQIKFNSLATLFYWAKKVKTSPMVFFFFFFKWL